MSHTLTKTLAPALILTLAFVSQTSHAAKDLFNTTESSKSAPAQQMISAPAEEIDIEPALSSTDAAVRAQQHIDGKVMNVRKMEDENKTLYGVKVLQKNGRVRTINVDANSGEIIE